MTIPPTYDLRREGTSEAYYREVRTFTDEVLEKASTVIGAHVDDYMAYVRTYKLEHLRSREEYLLELLTFGILWNAYGGYARTVRVAPFITLARMAEWRKRHARWKPAIDLFRGLAMTLFLLPRRGRQTPEGLPDTRDVDRLSIWLEATGEFREPALRFVRWRAFLETCGLEYRGAMSAAVRELAVWFAGRGESVLGRYTGRVAEFLEGAHDRYRWREDRVQCTRTRAEYHLNMVGAEIMNRAFRDAYRAGERRVALLPGCMRGRPAEECKAERTADGLVCTGCLAGCRVNQLREMGERKGFDVCIIPHASDLSRWSTRPGEVRRSVVAAACVTQLVEGGWELKRYDVPAQCVLLDFSGCQKHWDARGTPTALNTREFKRVLAAE